MALSLASRFSSLEKQREQRVRPSLRWAVPGLMLDLQEEQGRPLGLPGLLLAGADDFLVGVFFSFFSLITLG